MKLTQPVRRHVEAGIEPTLAADAATERYRIEAAVEPVTPLVIDAGVLGGIARRFTPHQRPAVSAAIDKGVDRAAGVAVDDDRRVADLGRAEIPVFRGVRPAGEAMPV